MTFKPMLAAKMDESAIRFPVLASPKLDGIRAIVIDGVVVSRSLKPIPNKHVQALFGKPVYEGFDGELIVGSPTDPNVYNKTTSGVMSVDGEPDVRFFVFDLANEPVIGYIARYITALGRMDECGASKAIIAVPMTTIESPAHLTDYESQAIDDGYEGVMIRRPDALYKHGRATAKSLDLMKIKREEDAEAEIVGTYEQMHNANEATTNALGHTERSTCKDGLVGADTLGGFTLRWPDGTTFDCSCGNLNHDERKELWVKRDTLRGQLLKFRYFKHGVKVNEDGSFKPRFPRAIGLRHSDDL